MAKVIVNKNKVLQRMRVNKINGIAIMTEQVYKDSIPYTPHRTGTMQDTAIVDNKKGEIIYIAPYSKKVWYGEELHFNRDINPLAGPLWCDRTKNDNKDKWLQLIKNIYKKGG